MIVSTKGRYAMRVMIDMAQHNGEGPIPLKEIADRQGISEKYLEAILRALVEHKIVSGVRGRDGGYSLLRDPSELTAWEVIFAVEKDFYAVTCLSPGADTCKRERECAVLPMWREFYETVKDFFGKYTIQDLAEGISDNSVIV